MTKFAAEEPGERALLVHEVPWILQRICAWSGNVRHPTSHRWKLRAEVQNSTCTKR